MNKNTEQIVTIGLVLIIGLLGGYMLGAHSHGHADVSPHQDSVEREHAGDHKHGNDEVAPQ